MIRASRTRPGLTLIELLGVVVIIALLMGLLVPVVSQARSVMDANTCRSNMQQISKAMTGYALQFGVLPGNMWDLPTEPRWAGKEGRWMFISKTNPAGDWSLSNQKIGGVLYRFLEQSTRVYVCPTQKKADFGVGDVACHYAVPTILSGMPLDKLARAYRGADEATGTRLPGVPMVVEPLCYVSGTTDVNDLGSWTATKDSDGKVIAVTWITPSDESGRTDLGIGGFEGSRRLDGQRHNLRTHVAYHDGNVNALSLGSENLSASQMHVILSTGKDWSYGGTKVKFEDWAN